MTVDTITSAYRKPFDLIAFAVADEHKNGGSDHADLSLRPVEYPQRGSNPCYRLERAMS